MYTSIKVSSELKAMLERMRMSDSESYEDIIQDLIEDHMALNPKFIEGLEKSRKEIAQGEFVTLNQLKKGLKSDV